LQTVLGGHRPGDRVPLVFVRRGERVARTLVLQENPSIVVVPVEDTGAPLGASERAFRDSWLE
jgi:hypothetical protein